MNELKLPAYTWDDVKTELTPVEKDLEMIFFRPVIDINEIPATT